jgi:hypothetical protein
MIPQWWWGWWNLSMTTELPNTRLSTCCWKLEQILLQVTAYPLWSLYWPDTYQSANLDSESFSTATFFNNQDWGPVENSWGLLWKKQNFISSFLRNRISLKIHVWWWFLIFYHFSWTKLKFWNITNSNLKNLWSALNFWSSVVYLTQGPNHCRAIIPLVTAYYFTFFYHAVSNLKS